MFKNRVDAKTLFKILCFFLIFFGAEHSHASFHKSLWPKWEVNNPLSKKKISHDQWQYFLNKYLITDKENINLIDYEHIKPEDLDRVKKYINKMSHIRINEYNRKEQLAYWINLYNALTVNEVAHYFPVASIQEINTSPGLFSIGPWGANIITINDTQLTLDDINNKIIRPIWNDARTHYALNNATIGAPNISKQVYQADNLEDQLNQAAFNYINSYRGVQVIEGKLTVSKIYEWFEEDFGGSKKDVLYHLAIYAKEPLKSQLKHINSIDSYIYNWHLNAPALDES